MPSQTLQQPFETLLNSPLFGSFYNLQKPSKTETRVVMHGGCATELD